MNMVMKWKRQTLEDKYDDLSELCNHVVFTGDFDDCVRDACSFYSQVLIDKEEIYLKIRRRNKMKKVLEDILGFFRAMIPQDEFEGRYEK